MPDRRVVFINRAISIEKPSGSIVVEGDDDHLAKLLDLIAMVAVDADKFFSCHFIALLS